jgi:hypothetical protein
VNWIHLAQYGGQWWAFFEHGIEPSGTMIGSGFPDQLNDYQFP